MDSVTNRLPFDVLCIIFEYCVTLDDSSQPGIQETLLLVSRSWYEAASSHARLWTNIDLNIKGWDDVEYWTSCLARRFARYSTDALLDIRISIGHRYGHRVPDHVVAGYTCERLLFTLVGEFGTIARRWRRFVVSSAFGYASSTVLAHLLSFPTPNLQEFSAVSLHCDREVLPDTSSLKSFSTIDCVFQKGPNLETVTHLTISFGAPKWGNGFDRHAIALARNLQSLKIRNIGPHRLCATYPHLKSLDLRGTIHEHCLTGFYAPNLNDITLIVSSGYDYLPVVFCAGIQLENVKMAKIGSWGVHGLTKEAIHVYLDGVRQLLKRLVSLDTLRFYEPNIIHFALKLLTGDCEHLYQSHTLRLELFNRSGELGKGEGRLSSVDRFRQQTMCLESDTVNMLLNA